LILLLFGNGQLGRGIVGGLRKNTKRRRKNQGKKMRVSDIYHLLFTFELFFSDGETFSHTHTLSLLLRLICHVVLDVVHLPLGN
jgi:uncharacterized protein YggL (DUF469 family)